MLGCLGSGDPVTLGRFSDLSELHLCGTYIGDNDMIHRTMGKIPWDRAGRLNPELSVQLGVYQCHLQWLLAPSVPGIHSR